MLQEVINHDWTPVCDGRGEAGSRDGFSTTFLCQDNMCWMDSRRREGNGEVSVSNSRNLRNQAGSVIARVSVTTQLTTWVNQLSSSSFPQLAHHSELLESGRGLDGQGGGSLKQPSGEVACRTRWSWDSRRHRIWNRSLLIEHRSLGSSCPSWGFPFVSAGLLMPARSWGPCWWPVDWAGDRVADGPWAGG